MAEIDTFTGDELLAVAIASGKTVTEAAKSANMSERTVYRRLRDAQFKERVQELRRRVVDGAIGRIVDSLGESANVLRSLLNSTDERVRLSAAVKNLTLGVQWMEVADLEVRVLEMEAEMDKLCAPEQDEIVLNDWQFANHDFII